MASALRAAFAEVGTHRKQPSYLKTDGSPLSQMDLALQRLLVEIIEEREQDPCVISEEDLNTALGRTQRCRRVWVIDPLDGTSQFLNSDSTEYCTTVTVVEGRVPVACLIYCPELGHGRAELVISVAGPGTPVLVDGDRALPASMGRAPRDLVSVTRGRQESAQPFDARLGDKAKLQATSLTIDMVRVALDLSASSELGPLRAFHRENQKAWDALAGIVVARASGLSVVDRNGDPITPLAENFLEAAEPTFASVVLAEKDDEKDFLELLNTRKR
jgi:fructose-1,6-bisphosphatase/inositol monophosphatase family enzyme